MKKLLVILTILVSAITFNVKASEIELPEKTDHEPVKIYLFYADYCSHCHEFIEYFLDNYKDEYKDYFEIVGIEAATSSKTIPDFVKANSSLASELKEYFEIDDSEFGWPFIVIGDYNTCGFATRMGEALINEALDQYQNESYEDVVGSFIEKSSDVKTENLKEAAVTAGIEVPDEKSGISDAVVVAIIFIVLIGGLGSLIFLSRK